MSALHNFLSSHRSQTHCSHTSTNPRGKYFIPENELDTFYKVYTNAFQTNKKSLSITEFSSNCYIPIIIDIDLKKEIDEDDSFYALYSNTNVADIVFCFIDVLKNILLNTNENDLCCFVMERDGYFVDQEGKKKYWKNGFHLHFPKIFLTRVQQEAILLPIVRETLRKRNVILPNNLTADTIFDDSIYKGKGKPWYLYGSTKKEASQPYLCSYMFHGSKKMDMNWEGFLARNEFRSEENFLENIVRFFSLLGNDKEIHYRQINPTTEMIEDKMVDKSQSTQKIPIYESNSHVDEIVDAMLSLLPSKYYEEYDLWIRIGWILHNEYLGTHEGFQRWDQFSKQSFAKYDSERITIEWSKMRLENYTHASLIHFVKQDNPEGFEQFFNERSENFYLSTLTQETVTHNDIANILYSKFSDKYKCASIKPNIWYLFSDHTWKLSDDGVELRNHISTTIVQRFLKMKNDISMSEKQSLEIQKGKIERDLKLLLRQVENIDDFMNELNCDEQDDRMKKIRMKAEKDKIIEEIDVNRNKLDSIAQQIHSKDNSTDYVSEIKPKKNIKEKRIIAIINQLKTVPFKRNIMLEASDLFRDADFLNRLNKNRWLIAFNNGVYDLKNHIFRDGEATDYISLKMSVNYREDFSYESAPVQMAKRFFEQIFPDENVREYFLAIQSEIFVGSNTRKIFQVWTGEGDNGKSITTDIFEKLLGPYAVKLPTSILFGKRTQSSSASPELERTGNGVRLVTIQEPNSDDTVNTGIMKELSGNDKFYARGLHKNPIEIEPMFTPVMICNKPPVISNSQHDEAVWNRLRIIPFESTFPRDDRKVPNTAEERFRQKIFYRDSNFADKIPDMLEGVAYYLLHIYRNRPSNFVLQEPEKVFQATNKYRKSNDVFRSFLDEKVEHNEEDDTKMYLSTVYERFKDWYRQSIPHGTMPKKDDLKDYLIRSWGEPTGKQNYWKHFSFVHEDMNE